MANSFIKGLTEKLTMLAGDWFVIQPESEESIAYKIKKSNIIKESIKIALGARGTDHTVASNVNGIHIDYDFTLDQLPTLEFDPILTNGGPTGASFIVDIKVGSIAGAGMTTIFSTLLSVDAGEYHSSTATIPAVLSTTTIAQYSFISVGVTQIGGTLSGQAGYVTLNGYRT